ncbi:MAG: hypothetical protein QXR58_02130 [Candidatus Micrarchaeaceae archaeon]
MKRYGKQSILFILFSLLFMVEASTVMVFGSISTTVLIAEMIIFALYFVAALAYINGFADSSNPALLHASDKKHWRRISYSGSLLVACFAAALFALALQFYSIYILGYPTAAISSTLLEYTVNFVLVLLSLSLVAVSAKIRYEKKLKNRRLLSYIFLLLAIAAMIAFYSSGAISYIMNDETYLGIEGFKLLLSGINPYTQNMSAQVYGAFLNHTITGPTLTSANEIVGRLDYPFLYVLSLAPFYFAHGAMHFVATRLLPLEVGFLVALLLFVLYLSLDFGRNRMLLYGIVLVYPFFMLSLVSPADLLLLVLLVLSIWKSSSKYVGVLFGIAASVQQLSWVPVLLLMLYIFNNHGIRRGSAVLGIALLTFLLINGYFLLAGAGAFIRNIFVPVSGSLLPGSYGPFGFYALLLGMPQVSVSKLYFIAIAFSALGMLLLNKKMLLGPLSMLPFAFLNHGLSTYYTLFVALTVISLAIKGSRGEDSESKVKMCLNRFSKNRSRFNAIAAAMVLLLLAAAVLLLYVTQPNSSRPFSIGAASLSAGNGGAYYYTMSISANVRGINNEYRVLLFGKDYNSSSVSLFGAYGENTLWVNGAPSEQRNYTFSVSDINPNVLLLRNSSVASVSIYAGNASAARCIIYNTSSFTICPAASRSG